MTTWYAQQIDIDISANSGGLSTVWNTDISGLGTWMDWTTPWAGLAAGDILAANGCDGLRVDGSIPACARLSTAAEGGDSGGTFEFTGYKFGTSVETGAVTIDAAIVAGPTTCLTISGGTITINGTVTGSTIADNSRGISITNNAVVTINGCVTAGPRAGAWGVYRQGTGSLTITVLSGNALVGKTSSTPIPGLYDSSISGTIIINGDIVSTSFPSYGLIISGGTTAVACVINGNLANNSIAGAVSYVGGPSSTLTINGDIYGLGNYSHSLSITGSGLTTIYGNAISNANGVGYAIRNGNTTTPTIMYGNLIASNYSPAYTSDNGAILKLRGNLIDSLNWPAYNGGLRCSPLTENYHQVYDWDGNAVKLPLQLSPAYVRSGIPHGDVTGRLGTNQLDGGTVF